MSNDFYREKADKFDNMIRHLPEHNSNALEDIIYQLSLNDYKELHGLLAESFYYTKGIDDLIYDILTSDYETFGIRKNNKLIGTIVVKDKGSNGCVVSSLAVAKNYRRQGIATNLLTFIINKNKNKVISLFADQGNLPAITLYNNNGFVKENDFETRVIEMVKKR